MRRVNRSRFVPFATPGSWGSTPISHIFAIAFTVAADLLSPSGSLFVQIGLDNVHLVRSILDEVFGSDNLMSMIAFRKTTTQSGDFLPDTNDYLLWYAKSRESAKYRALYSSREGTDWVNYDYARLPNGDYRRMTASERDNPAQLLCRLTRVPALATHVSFE